MEARSCEEYVLYLLDESEAGRERLQCERDDLARCVSELEREVARLRSGAHDAIYAAGRKAVFDRLAYCERDWDIKDFDEWCHACCYHGSTLYDEYGGVDGFVEEFEHEFREAWEALADE